MDINEDNTEGEEDNFEGFCVRDQRYFLQEANIAIVYSYTLVKRKSSPIVEPESELVVDSDIEEIFDKSLSSSSIEREDSSDCSYVLAKPSTSQECDIIATSDEESTHGIKIRGKYSSKFL